MLLFLLRWAHTVYVRICMLVPLSTISMLWKNHFNVHPIIQLEVGRKTLKWDI